MIRFRFGLHKDSNGFQGLLLRMSIWILMDSLYRFPVDPNGFPIDPIWIRMQSIWINHRFDMDYILYHFDFHVDIQWTALIDFYMDSNAFPKDFHTDSSGTPINLHMISMKFSISNSVKNFP